MTNETPAPSAPKTQTPRTDAHIADGCADFAGMERLYPTPEGCQYIHVDFARILELESAARQRVIDAIERECKEPTLQGLRLRILAIIADGKEGK